MCKLVMSWLTLTALKCLNIIKTIIYKNKTHYGCTDVDDSKKWCATDSDEFGTFKSYGECVGNCIGGILLNLELLCFEHNEQEKLLTFE